MNEGRAIFTRHHKPPFTWITSKWEGGNDCRITADLLGVYSLTIGDTARLREYRFEINNRRWISSHGEYECLKVSAPSEEWFMDKIFRLLELLSSPFEYIKHKVYP